MFPVFAHISGIAHISTKTSTAAIGLWLRMQGLYVAERWRLMGHDSPEEAPQAISSQRRIAMPEYRYMYSHGRGAIYLASKTMELPTNAGRTGVGLPMCA